MMALRIFIDPRPVAKTVINFFLPSEFLEIAFPSLNCFYYTITPPTSSVDKTKKHAVVGMLFSF